MLTHKVIPIVFAVLILGSTIVDSELKFTNGFVDIAEMASDPSEAIPNIPPNNSPSRSARCLCKLKPFPFPFPMPPGVGADNNVAAFQQLPDGRTALYNNQGQVIGYLPPGTSANNNG